MFWLSERISLWWRWLVATADESGPLSESTPEAKQSLSENTLQDGNSLPPDIDTRPVGRCHNEMNRVLELVRQARAIDAQLKTALTAFWACRDHAAAEAHAARQEPFTTPLVSAQAAQAATVFDTREYYLRWIERQPEEKP